MTSIKLFANKESDATTVSMDDVRKFIQEINDNSDQIKEARRQLKKAIEGDETLEELNQVLDAAKQKVKVYLETHTVYKEYLDQVEKLKELKKDIIADAKTLGIPKKEIDVAVKALKQDISLDSASEIYAEIADLVE
jgi:predicted  nucleic acid-binding Zn-ribbon protein